MNSIDNKTKSSLLRVVKTRVDLTQYPYSIKYLKVREGYHILVDVTISPIFEETWFFSVSKKFQVIEFDCLD